MTHGDINYNKYGMMCYMVILGACRVCVCTCVDTLYPTLPGGDPDYHRQRVWPRRYGRRADADAAQGDDGPRPRHAGEVYRAQDVRCACLMFKIKCHFNFFRFSSLEYYDFGFMNSCVGEFIYMFLQGWMGLTHSPYMCGAAITCVVPVLYVWCMSYMRGASPICVVPVPHVFPRSISSDIGQSRQSAFTTFLGNYNFLAPRRDQAFKQQKDDEKKDDKKGIVRRQPYVRVEKSHTSFQELFAAIDGGLNSVWNDGEAYGLQCSSIY